MFSKQSKSTPEFDCTVVKHAPIQNVLSENLIRLTHNSDNVILDDEGREDLNTTISVPSST